MAAAERTTAPGEATTMPATHSSVASAAMSTALRPQRQRQQQRERRDGDQATHDNNIIGQLLQFDLQHLGESPEAGQRKPEAGGRLVLVSGTVLLLANLAVRCRESVINPMLCRLYGAQVGVHRF